VPVDVKFAGWFQIRLATDPDPHDEPHGISGYTWSLPGEPDFDRLVRFQPEGTFTRVGCAPEIAVGVTVRRVVADGREAGDHPLLGAPVTLADEPKFEGRNGVVAGNGLEPIVPFHIRLDYPGGVVARAFGDTYEFPYTPLRATGIDFSDDAKAHVRETTGIDDLGKLWQERADRLKLIAGRTDDPALEAACLYRIDFLREQADLAGDFGLIVRYGFDLAGASQVTGPLTGGTGEAPWPVKFWMGAWDFDALCAYVHGTLTLPSAA
jgi:hypothetical protein